MYRSTRFESPRHILWWGRLVYGLDKLTLDKIDLKNRKSLIFQCFQTIFQVFIFLFFFFLNTSTCNGPILNCIVLNLNTLSSITPFLNLAYSSLGLMAVFFTSWWGTNRSRYAEWDISELHRKVPQISYFMLIQIAYKMKCRIYVTRNAYKKILLNGSWFKINFLIPNHNLPPQTGFSVQYGEEGHNVPRPPNSLPHRDWTQHIH